MAVSEPASSSAPSLRRGLRAVDYFTLAFGSMVGVGWMVVIDDWLARGGSVGAMLGFLLGGLALLPVAYVYGRMTERMPDAGSEIAYTGAVFPEWASFAAGWSMTLAYLIVCPYEAVAIGRIASYAFSRGMDTMEMYSVAGRPVYLPHLLAGLGLTAVIVVVNYRGVTLSAAFQNITTFGLLAIFAVFSALGLIRGNASNLQPPFAHGEGASGGILSTLLVLQIVPYFMTGFEAAPKCSEEAAAHFESRHFTKMIFLALGAGIFFYVVVIGVVSAVQPWQSLAHEQYATAVAFRRAFGSETLVQFIMLGVLLSLLKIYNGNFLTSSRLVFAMGRRGLLDRRLSRLHPRYQTPSLAIILIGCAAALASFLGQAVLVPISEVGSLASAVGWFATCAAFCCGAGGRIGGGARVIGLCGALIAAAMIAMKLIPWVPGSFGVYEFIAMALWAGLGVILWIRETRAKARRRKETPRPETLDVRH